MDRRDFLKTSGILAGASAWLGVPTLGGPTLPRALIPPDKGYSPEQLAALRVRGQRRAYTGAGRFALGMPIGGIGAGQVYLLGDGSLGGWHIDGRLNATGYGDTSYRIREPERNLMQGVAILRENRPEFVQLKDPEHGGVYDQIEFIGEYPLAEVRYRGAGARQDASNLEVTLRAFSPFIPLNAKDSALPCAILRYTVRNLGTLPERGHLVAYLQSAVEPSVPGEPSAVARLRTIAHPACTTLLFDAVSAPEQPGDRSDRPLADFDSGDYRGWTATGEAFGKKPASGTFPTQQKVSGFDGPGLVNSYADNDDLLGELWSDPFTIDRRYLLFRIGGGAHAGRTCVNLEVDGKVMRTATGRNNEALEPRAWDVAEFEGKAARIRILDAQKGPWGHINADSFRLADRLPDDLKRPRPDSLTFGTMAVSCLGEAWGIQRRDGQNPGVSGKPVPLVPDATGRPLSLAELAAPFDLRPGESRTCTFVISWHFPNLHTGRGQMYTNWFDDAAAVAQYVADNFPRLLADTELFRKTYYDDTTLPWWLASRLMMPTANLATGTAQWWKNGRFWGWEGVGCCAGTCAHVWNYSHAEARLFPELARSVRTMQDLGTAFEEGTGRVAFRGDAHGGSDYAADGQAGTILKCYREHLTSPDHTFLTTNWPRIKQALEFLIARDAVAPATPDGILEDTQPNTFDIDFVGPNTFVGSLYLAALLAGAAMADLAGDARASTRYRELHFKGRAWTEKHLYNGRYFIQTIPFGAADRFQYGPGCLSDQLFGQSWSRLLDLGTVYDEQQVRTALASIYRYNFAPATGQYAARFPPQRVFAEGREAGLLECTWPDGGRPGEPVLYRDEVWTGTEYQVATGMLWEGLTDEALVIIKAIDDRYDGAAHNPWNEVECGDHYARAMAAWGAFQALTGFVYDGPAGRIGMSPRITPDDFAAFFSAAEGWGLLSQRRTAGSQTNRVEVRWGRVRIREFVTDHADGRPLALAGVQYQGRPVAAKVVDGPRACVVLDQPVEVAAGEVLEVTWRS